MKLLDLGTETILAKLGPIVRETVIVEGRTFIIDHPSESDRFIKGPTPNPDEYIPYWAELWPASRMLAKIILRESWAPGTEALELGCGLGLTGIAALSMGLKVTFSDHDPLALRFAADNARLNGYHDFEILQLDWYSPPTELRANVILGSDLVYELRHVAPLVALLKKVLLPGGRCLIADQDRVPGHLFKEALQKEGLAFTSQMVRAGEPGGRRSKGTFYRITV